MYNVESYLRECLDSVRAQAFQGVEVLLVDDGSVDRTLRIARKYARRDPRIRIITQPNAGPSAARNFGVTHAHAEYLTFLDSDDVLPADAWSRMVEVLDRTGSDLAVGKIERFRGSHRFATARMTLNHAEDRLALTAGEMPEILADVFPVNKVYRRAFWDAGGFEFPVGLNYEDQPVLTRAFLTARTFDVLADVVYLYRVRDDGTSRTQSRHEYADLVDRVHTKRMTVELVHAHGDPEVTRVFHADVLPVDMWEYFRSVPGCTDDYWSLLREAVREFWNERTVPFEATLVPVQQRLMGWLVSQDRRADLVRLVEWIDGLDGPLPFRGDELLHPWHGAPELPDGVTRLASHVHEVAPQR